MLKERRRLLARSHYAGPELLATWPNQFLSWDMTKLKRPYYLGILDAFNFMVVG
jgi:hypothetical protein